MAELHPPKTADGHEDKREVRHETSDVDIRAILGFLAGLIVVAACIHLMIAVLFKYFEAREARRQTVEYPLAASEGARVPPEPRLQTSPRQDLRDLSAEEDEILSNYAWVDRNAGVVRIPIDEAMRLTVQRGLPAREVNK